MKNKRLKQVLTTLAFLRSVILSGESMTEEVRDTINESIDNIKKIDEEHNGDYNFYLPFNNVNELLKKTKKITDASKESALSFRNTLREKGINFGIIDDYRITIDMSSISEDDISFLLQQNNSFIQDVYKEIGVISSKPQAK